MTDSSFQDPVIVGKTKEAQQRNAQLLSGYDYSQYPEFLTGYAGQDRQRIAMVHWTEAVRTRVGPRGNYKAGMTRLPDGKLIIAICRDNNKEDSTKRHFNIFVYESADEGMSWQEIAKTPVFGKELSLTALPDGTLVMTAQNGYFGPGAKFDEIPLSRSEDGGRTWQTQMIPGSGYPRNMIVEPDGGLLMIRDLRSWWPSDFAEVYFSKEYAATAPSTNLQLARSTDAGKTWQYSEGLVDWDCTAFWEISAVHLKDGRLLAALRIQIPQTKGEAFETTVLTESSDDGKHWTKPRQMTNAGEVHVHLTELNDGRIVATYSNYHLPWGTYAIVSTDGGKSWDLEHPIQLSLSNGGDAVGWPVTLQLPDGSLVTSHALTAYAHQLPDKTTCEVVRWRLP